jgi:protein TonB
MSANQSLNPYQMKTNNKPTLIKATSCPFAIPVILIFIITLLISLEADGQIVENPDIMPEYKGGIANFYRTLQKNIKYPDEARKTNAQGKVFISFTVNSKGKIVDIEAGKDTVNLMEEIVVVGYFYTGIQSVPNQDLSVLEKESKRALQILHKFNPATKDGIPVDTRLTLPIRFKLARGRR